jgi:hypothetical protein
MRVDSAVQQAAIEAVARAANATGADFAALLETAKRESGLDKTARAASSSAAGLFQFVESTWLGLLQRYGPRHGVAMSGDRQALLDLRYDPEIASVMAGELTRENAAVLEAKLGRAATSSELYAAHVLGAEGALKLIDAPENARAASLLPRAAAANRALFYEPGGAPRSAQALLQKLALGGEANADPAPAPAAAPVSVLVTSAVALSQWREALGVDLWSLALRAYRRSED